MNEYMIGQFGWIEWMIYVTEMFKKNYKNYTQVDSIQMIRCDI